MAMVLRAAGALAAVLLLSACLVTPGKFVSTLDIRADRSFTFAYKGEVIASDMGQSSPAATSDVEDQSFERAPEGDAGSLLTAMLWQDGAGAKGDRSAKDKTAPEERFDDDDAIDPRKMNAIAAALMKEKGYRAARYVGKGKFEIDYAISGRLDHMFLFPFNIDAQIILPFVAVELRGDDRVRVKAPGFANSFDKTQGPGGLGGPSEAAMQALDGSFTLTTDAEIVSQNEEGGAQDVAQGKRMVWTITPNTSEAPAAMLRVRSQ
ncbi:MAG: hypothetical protein ABW039_13810 [Sphingobium sp.]